MKSFEEQLSDAVIKKAISEKDLDALALKLKPVILKKIESSAVSAINNIDFDEAISDALPWGQIERILKKILSKAISK